MKQSLRLWHRRLSYFALIPWAWLVLTGSALIVGHFFRDFTGPFYIGGASAPLAEQLESALNLSGAQIARVNFAAQGSSLRVLTESAGTYFFNSAGQEIAHQPKEGTDWLELITRLHRGRFAGLPGQIVFSIFALFLCVFTLSGVLIWRPQKIYRLRGWHRFLGGVSSLPLLILFLTGGLWNLSAQIRGPLGSGGARVIESEEWRSSFTFATQFDSNLKSIHKLTGLLMAELDDGSRIYFVQGEQPQVFRSWSARGWIEPVFNIHSGRIWGWFGRALAALTTLSALVLLYTGIVLIARK